MTTGTRVISRKEKASFGLAALGNYMVCGITQSYLMYFFSDILIIPSAFVAVLMIAARVWDAVNDPIMGVVIDKTNTKMGKMRPYIFVGAFLILTITILLFLPITDADVKTKMVYAAVTYLLFGMTYTLIDVPTMGLMSVATPDNEERASLLAFYVTVGSVASLFPIGILSIFQTVFSEKWVYFAMAVLVGVITFIGYLGLFFNSKERFATHTEKTAVKDIIRVVKQNQPMVMTLLMSMLAAPRYLIMPTALYISTYVIAMPNMSSGTVLLILYAVVGTGMFAGVFMTPVIYKKIGYKQTCRLAALVGGIGLCTSFFVSRMNYFAAMPFLTIGGLGLGAYNVLPSPMVGDSLDYLEWKTGKRMEGTCFSMYTFVTKYNNAVGFIGLSIALIVFRFAEPSMAGVPLPQSEFTKTGLFSLVTLIPGISFLLSLIPIHFYRYEGKEKERILAELAQKKSCGSAE